MSLSSSEENILFIMEVLAFIKIKERKKQKEYANIIYHNFIRISSDKELNMSLKRKSSCEARIKKGDISCDMYDEILHEITFHMGDSFSRFYGSDEVQKLMKRRKMKESPIFKILKKIVGFTSPLKKPNQEHLNKNDISSNKRFSLRPIAQEKMHLELKKQWIIDHWDERPRPEKAKSLNMDDAMAKFFESLSMPESRAKSRFLLEETLETISRQHSSSDISVKV